jgi:hypothetical protein
MAACQCCLTSEMLEGMREHDIRRFFMAAKCRESGRQEVGCRVVVNDEDVCRGANGSKAGHIRKNQDSGYNSW